MNEGINERMGDFIVPRIKDRDRNGIITYALTFIPSPLKVERTFKLLHFEFSEGYFAELHAANRKIVDEGTRDL